MKKNNSRPVYGNWVSTKIIALPAGLGAILSLLGFAHVLFLVPGIIFLAVAVYFTVARWFFSPAGGDVQNRVLKMLTDFIRWNGRGDALDIGCGNGQLTIKLASLYPEARVTGLDYWGQGWDYSEIACMENARLSGVENRVTFRQGSAACLPFKDDSFDLVVSNLTFHEVKDAPDKRQSLREALRILKPGGEFVLQDLFLLRPYYGTPEELLAFVRGCGVKEVDFIRTCDETFIPAWVRLPFMIGTLAILRGIK